MSNIGELRAELTLGVQGFQKGSALARRESQKTKAAIKDDFDQLAKAADIALGGKFNYSASGLRRSPDLVAYLRENAKVMQEFQRMTRGTPATGLQGFLNQALGVGAGQNRPNAGKSVIPPVIPPPITPRPPAGQGGQGGGFGGAFLNRFTGAGGAGNIFLGNFAAFAVIRVINEVVDALKYGARKITEAFEQGFNLFTKSAQVGFSSKELFARRYAAAGLGMSEADLQGLMLRTQGGFGGPKGSYTSYQQNRQINSLIDLYQKLKLEGDKLGAEWQKITGQLYTTRESFRRTGAVIDLFWAQIAANVAPVLRELSETVKGMPWKDLAKVLGDGLVPVIHMVTTQFKIFSVELAIALKLLKFVPGMQAFNSIADAIRAEAEAKNPAVKEGARMTNYSPIATGQWEKLGLSFGAGAGESVLAKYARETAKNTALIAAAMAGGGFAAGLGASLYMNSNAP